jgi:hypothetical protein
MRIARLLRLLPLILLPTLALTACAGGNSKSPDFKAGYSDGCASASLQGADKREDSLTRDDAAYRTNKDYHSGWGQGFGSCRSMNAPSSPGAGPFGTGQFGGQSP